MRESGTTASADEPDVCPSISQEEPPLVPPSTVEGIRRSPSVVIATWESRRETTESDHAEEVAPHSSGDGVQQCDIMIKDDI